MADQQTQLDIIIHAQDNASKSLRQIDEQLNAMQQSVTGLSATNAEGQSSVNGLTGAFLKAGLALEAIHFAAGLAEDGVRRVISLGEDALRSAADYEQIRVAFDGLLGSADKARVLLKEVSDYAVKTPFTLPTVAEGAKKLLAFGVANEQIIPTFKMLGDISLGNTDKLGYLIHAFGQVTATGHLMGRELLEFRMQGVNLGGALAKQFGVTQDAMQKMVEKGQVGLPAVEQALSSMTSKGGLFFQGMERQSKTFNGTITNLQDDFGRLGRQIVGISDSGDIRQGSLFAKLKDAAQGLLSYVDKNRDAIAAFASKELDQMITFVNTQAIPALQKFGKELGAYLSYKQFQIDLKNATDDIIGIANALKTVADIGGKVANVLNNIHGDMTRGGKDARGFFAGAAGAAGNWYQHLGDNKRASGGPVSAGQSYLVGENSPELFVPSQNGSILNQSQMKGMGGQSFVFNNYGNLKSDLDIRGAMREFGFMVTR
ncbi:MAG: tape measure protein [Thermomicrobiales bacterium]